MRPIGWGGQPKGVAKVPPAADCLEVAYGLVDPSATREWMLVVRNAGPLPQQFEAGEVIASAVPVFRSPLGSLTALRAVGSSQSRFTYRPLSSERGDG